MEKLSKFLPDKRPPRRKIRATERGHIFDLILARLNPSRISSGYKPLTHGRLGFKLTGIPTKDLYALISKCDDAERRGYAWGAIFWRELKPNDKST